MTALTNTPLGSAETLPNGTATYVAQGGVALITLTNPPVNGYSHAMMRDIDEAVLRARFDDAVHVIMRAGAGEKYFCAGADIGMLDAVTPTFKYQFCLHANETLLRLEHTPKLVIAALGGHCVGGGLEIATDRAPTGGRRWHIDLMRDRFLETNRFRRVVLDAVLVDASKILRTKWEAWCDDAGGRVCAVEL